MYSHEDIARLLLIVRALEAGFRPGEVVGLDPINLARLLDATGADASSALLSLNASPSRTAAVAFATPDAIIDAVRADDIAGVRALLRASAIALGPRAFVTDLAHPLAVRVGELWADGIIDVRHEHATTACLTLQLHLLLGALDGSEVRHPTVLLATLPGEPHLLGLEMVGVYLAASLAAPQLLGADTPPAQIVEAARASNVDVVGLTVTPAAERRAAARGIAAVAEGLPDGTELWLGGAGARAVSSAAATARVVATWPELDAALHAVRERRARTR